MQRQTHAGATPARSERLGRLSFGVPLALPISRAPRQRHVASGYAMAQHDLSSLRTMHSCNANYGKALWFLEKPLLFQMFRPIAWLPFWPGTFCDATEFSSVTLGWRELNPTRFLTVVLHLIHASLASEFG